MGVRRRVPQVGRAVVHFAEWNGQETESSPCRHTSLGLHAVREGTLTKRAIPIAALVAALGVAGCAAGPPLDVAQNVDLSRFQGKWYEIAKLPRTTQTDCNGTTVFYTLAPDGSLDLVNQCNIGGATGPIYTVAMTANAPDKTGAREARAPGGRILGRLLDSRSGVELRIRRGRAPFALVSLDPQSRSDAGSCHDTGHSRPRAGQLSSTPRASNTRPSRHRGGTRFIGDSDQGPFPPAEGTGCSISRA